MRGLIRTNQDALLRTAQTADIADIRCLLVHTKDDTARPWYESWEFEPGPTDPYHLFLMLKDLKRLAAGVVRTWACSHDPWCRRRKKGAPRGAPHDTA